MTHVWANEIPQRPYEVSCLKCGTFKRDDDSECKTFNPNILKQLKIARWIVKKTENPDLSFGDFIDNEHTIPGWKKLIRVGKVSEIAIETRGWPHSKLWYAVSKDGNFIVFLWDPNGQRRKIDDEINKKLKGMWLIMLDDFEKKINLSTICEMNSEDLWKLYL